MHFQNLICHFQIAICYLQHLSSIFTNSGVQDNSINGVGMKKTKLMVLSVHVFFYLCPPNPLTQVGLFNHNDLNYDSIKNLPTLHLCLIILNQTRSGHFRSPTKTKIPLQPLLSLLV